MSVPTPCRVSALRLPDLRAGALPATVPQRLLPRRSLGTTQDSRAPFNRAESDSRVGT
jgi:hypothetical protein